MFSTFVPKSAPMKGPRRLIVGMMLSWASGKDTG